MPDLSKLSDEELAALYEQAAKQVRTQAPTTSPGHASVPRRHDLNPQAVARAQRSAAQNKLTSPLAGTPFERLERPAQQGASLGFVDELIANAASLPTSAQNALARRGIGEKLPYSGDQLRDAILAVEKGELAQVRKDRPVASLAAEFTGGSLLPGASFIGGAKSLPGAIVRSSAVGGGTGALYGAGAAEGGLGERAKGAVKGGLTGLAVGGAVPVAARGAQQVPRLLQRAGSGVSEGGQRLAQAAGINVPIGEVIPPSATRQAEEVVSKIAQRRGVTPEAIAADPRVPRGAIGAELLGREGVMLATGLGRRGGAAPDILEGALRPRTEGRAQALAEDLGGATGLDPTKAFDDFAAQAASMRAKASPLYDQAYAVGVVDSPTLQSLANRPSVKKAFEKAAAIAAEEGDDPATLGIIQGENGLQLVNPTAKAWDYVKRGLDDVIEDYRDPTSRRLNLDTAGRAADGTREALRKELIALNPAYGQALEAGGDPIRLEQAFRDSQKLFGNGVGVRDFAGRLKKMGEGEKGGLIAGLVDDLQRRADTGKLRPKDYQTPAFRQKLELALGREKAAQFLESLRIRNDLAATGQRIMPGTNSTTGEVSETLRDLDRNSSIVGRIAASQNPIRAVPGAVAQGLIGDPLAGLVRGMQAPYGRAVRDELGRILASPDDLSAALQNVATRPQAPRLGQSAVPRLSSPSAAMAGAAAGGTLSTTIMVGGRPAAQDENGVWFWADTGEPIT